MASDLIEVAKVGNLQQMALLVKGGQDVNEQESEELTTPLYWAACCGQVAACDWLIRKGADINKKVKWLSTPLHAAADRENMNCVLILIQNGAKLDMQNNNGDTPLHKAAYRGNVPICNILLQSGASVDVKNAQYKTPKAEAQCRKHFHAFELLAKWENDMLMKNKGMEYCLHSKSSNSETIPLSLTATLTTHTHSNSAPLSQTWTNTSVTVCHPVQEYFCCLPQDRVDVESTSDSTGLDCFRDISTRVRNSHEMSPASQSVGSGSHVELKPCDGHPENWGNGPESANQNESDNSGYRKEGNQSKKNKHVQLEEYILQLQLKLTEKTDRIEKLEKDRRQVITGLTKLRSSMVELQEVKKENEELHKCVEKTEQKYCALSEEMTAVKAHNRQLVLELNDLKLRLESSCNAVEMAQISNNRVSSDNFLATINSVHSGVFSRKFLVRGASSPEITALRAKAETAIDANRCYDLYSVTLPVFRSIDRSCLVKITAQLTQQLTARSLSWKQHLLLDIPGRPWQHDVDYVVIGGLPVLNTPDPESQLPSRFSLRINHKEKNYVLMISMNTEEHSSERCECSVPPHQNVAPILHSYDSSLLTLNPSHDASPVNLTDYKATFTITPEYSVTMNNFFTEHRKRHPHPPFRLPLRFCLHLLFELIMVTLHLEQHLVDKCLDISKIFLDDSLQVKYSETASSLMRPCESNEHSEDVTEREALTQKTEEDTNVNRLGQFFFDFLCCQTDKSVTMTSQLAWLPATFCSIILDMLNREERLSSQEAFVRVGLHLFGPKSNEITCLLDCEIWLQTRMLILLSQKQQKMHGVTTIAESVTKNDPYLDAEFLNHITAEEIWKHHMD